MGPQAELFFNIIILAGLGVTVFYCLRLSRQLAQMRADRKAFETLIQGINAAAARAEASVRALRETGEALQERLGKARGLGEELEIIIAAGDSLANRLQAQAEKSRKALADEGAPPPAEPQPQPRTRAERELQEALKAKRPS